MIWYLLDGVIHEGDPPRGAQVLPGPKPRGKTWNGSAYVDATQTYFSPEHVAEAHAIKFIEAQLILAGTALPDGVIAAEAEATGETVEAISQAVMSARAKFIEREAARRKQVRSS